MKKPTVSFSFKDENEHETYTVIAHEMGCSLSTLARMALKEYCRRRKKLIEKEKQ